MKKLNKATIILLLFFAGQSNVKAQIPIDIKAALQNSTWKIENTIDNYTVTFTDNRYTFYLDGKTLGNGALYYLSETACFQVTFDENKVTQTSNGNYMITKSGCLEIEFLSNNRFRMRSSDESQSATWDYYRAE